MTAYERVLHECPRCGNPLASLQFGPCLRTHLNARLQPDRFPLPDGFGLYRTRPWPASFAAEDYGVS